MDHAADAAPSAGATGAAAAAPSYLAGFGNEFATEALPGALPVGRNSPQRPAYGLYAEQISGTAFTAPRAENRRTWTYRIRPSAGHPPFRPLPPGRWLTPPLREVPPAGPGQLRWDPWPLPDAPCDFLDGLVTIAANGDAALQTGMAALVYAANRDMADRVLYDADGELLLVPQQGRLRLATELGILEVAPGEIALIPRGLRFRVHLPDGNARGYACENYGAPFRLPELGPIGANGLANPRDFLAPVAAYEDHDRPVELVARFQGGLWTTTLDHSPLDVVAWHGTLAPCKYDCSRFNALGTVSFDHPDPSIFTVLTAPSERPGTANVDFVIFPPRWMVAEDTFRPPWFHRNVMSEFMGLVHGRYDAKRDGFLPGGASLHNATSPHGPDAETFERASTAALAPVKLDGTLAFMFESRFVLQPTAAALAAPTLQHHYWHCWSGLGRRFTGMP